MTCYYCKSLDHDESVESCPERKKDAQRFVNNSPYEEIIKQHETGDSQFLQTTQCLPKM